MGRRKAEDASGTGGTLNPAGGGFPETVGIDGDAGQHVPDIGDTSGIGGDNGNGSDTPGNAGSGSDTPEGGNPSNGNSTLGTQKRRKYTKRGTAKTSSASASLALVDQIKGAHFFVAMLSGCPELVLQDNEAEAFAKALDTFNREFGIQVSTKVLAVTGLVTTGAMIYIPRGAQIFARKRAEKVELLRKQKEAREAGQIRITPEGVELPDAAV